VSAPKYATDEERREAKRACQRRSYAENPARKLARDRRYIEDNAEEVRDRRRRYREAHRDEETARIRHWLENNPEKVAAMNQRRNDRRRTRVVQALGDGITETEWLELREEFDHACAYCHARNVPLQRDHARPLAHPTEPGRHDASNIVPACRSCNSRKHTRTLLEFAEMPPRPLPWAVAA
jgi:5-methylcytosine-specific restriction endonuclease McrA